MTIRQAVQNAARNAYCQAAGISEALNDAINKFNPIPTVNPARAARGLICNNPTPPPTPQPPFSGGQCAGVAYRIQGTHNARNANNQQPISGAFSVGRVGPITSVSGETVDSNGFKTSFVTITSASGTERVDSFGGCEFVSVSGVTVTRLDGQPDNCGNPTPTPAPFPTGGLPVNIPPVEYTDNGGNIVVTVPTVVILPPIVNVKGEVNVPINVTIEGITFEANLNINTGDVNIGTGTGSGNRPRGDDSDERDNTEIDSEPPTSGTDGEDLEEDEPEEGERRIFGVIVTTTQVQQRTRLTVLAQNVNPDIYVPSLGHINFLYRIGNGTTGGWGEDIKIKNRRQFIPCPWKYGAVDVRGTPQPGVQFVLTPVYDSVQSQVANTTST